MRFRRHFFPRQVQFLKAGAMGVVLAVSFFWQCKAHPATGPFLGVLCSSWVVIPGKIPVFNGKIPVFPLLVVLLFTLFWT
jgi:hypothetical protein